MERGVSTPNSAAALQNHLLAKSVNWKKKKVNSAPTSLYRLSTPLANKFSLYDATLKGTNLSPYWAGKLGPAAPMGAYLGCVVKTPGSPSRGDSALLLTQAAH